MRVKIGHNPDQYEVLWSLRDYLDVMRDKISHEFVRTFESEFFISEDKDSEGFSLAEENEWMQRDIEHLESVIDEVNSTLQQYLVSLQQGKRVNREALMKMLKELIKTLDEAR